MADRGRVWRRQADNFLAHQFTTAPLKPIDGRAVAPAAQALTVTMDDPSQERARRFYISQSPTILSPTRGSYSRMCK